MTEALLPAFRFTTEAQWASCLFVGADRDSAAARAGMTPVAPYDAPRLVASEGAFAPAMAGSTLVWRDGAGRLQRLRDCDDAPRAERAPAGLAEASRIVAGRGLLWAIDAAGRVGAFDEETLARLIVLDLAGESALDIAGDGRGGLHVLATGAGGARILHFGGAGQLCAAIPLAQAPDAGSFVYLLRAERFVVLSADGSHCHWIDAATGALIETILVAAWRGCFTPTAIGTDGCSRLFLAGIDGAATGGTAQALTIDAAGDLVGRASFTDEPTGVAATGGRLHVSTAAGVLRFEPAEAVPLGAAEVDARLVTPALQSPAAGAQRWSRVEATVVLPHGCSLEIAFISVPDKDARDRIDAGLCDAALPPRQRLDAWRKAGAVSAFVFHGGDDATRQTIAAPLHDVGDEFLWVEVGLVAAPGGALPRLEALSVHYPGPALIDQLPAIYRRGERETGNFLRGFTGVLEATTQDLDARIADLGRLIHPRSAPPEWLDAIAGWMGLPWDESLSTAQKRAIVENGAALIRGHGARAGLEQLLAALTPERPRRFRVIDCTADYGFATLGGERCAGSALPAMLTGLARDATVLGVRARLGRARLPADGGEPDTARRLVGRIIVELAVDASERVLWEPLLATLLRAMLPAHAQLDLRWLAPGALSRGDVLAEGATLGAEPLARLGADATIGRTRLGGQARETLPGRISRDSALQ